MAVNCGVVHRRGLDPLLPWLWCTPAATALIQPLAWECPYAALKKKWGREIQDEPGISWGTKNNQKLL